MNLFILLDKIERPFRWLYCELVYGPWVIWQLHRAWPKKKRGKQ